MSLETDLEVRRIDALLNSLQTTPPPGRKDDDGKPRWDLLPFAEAEEVVKVLTYGARRYGDHNWRQVDNAPNRYLAAALRHISAHRQGAPLDYESGLPHLAHAVASLLFIMALEREGQ